MNKKSDINKIIIFVCILVGTYLIISNFKFVSLILSKLFNALFPCCMWTYVLIIHAHVFYGSGLLSPQAHPFLLNHFSGTGDDPIVFDMSGYDIIVDYGEGDICEDILANV